MEKLKNIKNVVQIIHYVFHQEVAKNDVTIFQTSLIYVVMELADCNLGQMIRKNGEEKKYINNNKLVRWTYQLIDTLAIL